MPYRPSIAGFERTALPPIVGVLPASFMAAAIGSAVTFAGFLVLGATNSEPIGLNALPATVLYLLLLAIPVMACATVFCMIFIAMIGVPVAWLMGTRLGTTTGLIIATALATSTAMVLGAMLETLPLGLEPRWAFSAIVLAYALPAAIFYRRSVLDARTLGRIS